MSDWIREAVGDGLEALLALRLKNAPAEDMIELTADIWVQAFSQRCFYPGDDAPRIREAFRRIFPKIREWPAPIDVITLMPSRPERAKLPAPKPSATEHAENVARVKSMLKDLVEGWGPKSTRGKT